MRKNWSIHAVDQMLQMEYPGNVRELRNIVERVLVLSEQDTVIETDVFQIVHGLQLDPAREAGGATLKEMVQAYEREILQLYFSRYGTEEAVAKALGSSQSTISRKRTQYQICPPENG